MVVGIQSLNQVTYDPRTGRYRSPYGGFLSRADMQSLIAQERRVLETKLLRKANQLIKGKDLGDWERAVAYELKISVIQATVLGAGGKDATTSKHYGMASAELRRQYEYLHKFAEAIAKKELSEAQIRYRVQLYANTIQVAYNQSEKITRTNQGFKFAKRMLSPMARHCFQCPAYQTNGWVLINTIIPVGVGCDCGGNCQCSVAYKK